jgi:hypothetical protein
MYPDLNIPVFTKEQLIDKFRIIHDMGWIKSLRPGNDGAVGNTLEDLLGIKENNLPIANCTDWELKAQRSSTSSLITLFHMDPSPRGVSIVTSLLLPHYGWQHKKAGSGYSSSEMSFRCTTSANKYTDRGFIVIVDRNEKKVKFSFNKKKVDKDKHGEWLSRIKKTIGSNELNPQPYWGFSDLMYKAGSKLKNTFFVLADQKKDDGEEYFLYKEVFILANFNFDNFLNCIDNGLIVVDFDARSKHNHGTKYRIKQNHWPDLYETVEQVV